MKKLSEEEHKKFHQQWTKIVTKAWIDKNFKAKLLKAPLETLKQEGLQLPSGITLSLHENTENKLHLILPEKPEGKLSEEELRKIAAACNKLPYCD